MNHFNDNALTNSSRRKIKLQKKQSSRKILILNSLIICAIFSTLAVSGILTYF